VNVSPRTAKSLVITGTAATAILSALVSMTEGSMPSIRVGVGATFIGAGLYAMTDYAPSLAAAFGVLMFTGAIYRHGPDLAGKISAATS
jgi:Ni,Fe-hydrogenase III small subunit